MESTGSTAVKVVEFATYVKTQQPSSELDCLNPEKERYGGDASGLLENLMFVVRPEFRKPAPEHVVCVAGEAKSQNRYPIPCLLPMTMAVNQSSV